LFKKENYGQVCFSFHRLKVSLDIIVTKGNVLSLLARILDPLGLTTLVISGKTVFHKLWKFGLDWDEEVPEEFPVPYVAT
jgi:hypothetical protein